VHCNERRPVQAYRGPGGSVRRAADPGSPKTPRLRDPGPAVHRFARAIASEDARKRAYRAAPHPGNEDALDSPIANP